MKDDNGYKRCPDCGADFALADGVTHAYLGGSPACWAAFNDVLAREFQDATYFAAHQFTVDAYTVQHPGDQSDRRAAQSVNIHLAALCALIEQEWEIASIPHLLKTLANNYKDKFEPLPPPAPDTYALTVKDALMAENAQQHCNIIRDWAEDVWRAWAVHHDIARAHVQRVNAG
ncbi:MAG: DUF5946 family protein [Hyphococcus sp.]